MAGIIVVVCEMLVSSNASSLRDEIVADLHASSTWKLHLFAAMHIIRTHCVSIHRAVVIKDSQSLDKQR